MTRISKVPLEQWDPALRELMAADQATPLEQGLVRLMAHTPEITKAWLNFAFVMGQRLRLPRRLVELVRLRIAFHNQCRSCMAIRYQSAVDAGVTENLVCSLARPFEAPDLTAAEKVALAYADLSANDHLSIGDDTFASLREHFDEGQIVELGIWIANCIGFGRLAAAWDMVEELPESYQENSGEQLAPWQQPAVVVRG